MKPHKHSALIKAWADGAEIEMYYIPFGKWMEEDGTPSWDKNIEYRIKPEKEYPKSSLTDTHLENILRINRGLCDSMAMARVVANAAVAQYVRETEE